MTATVARPARAVKPHQTGGPLTMFSDALVLAQRHLRHIPRNPELLVFATIQPVMFVVLFRYVFGGAIAIDGTTYVNYLMPGIFVQTVTFGSMMTGTGLAQDMTRGLIDRFRSLPMSRFAVLLGRTISDLIVNTLVVAIMLLVGVLVGFRPEGSAAGWAGGLGLLLLVSFTFSWIAATIGLFARSVEAVNSAGFIWLFPLTFCSSAYDCAEDADAIVIMTEWDQFRALDLKRLSAVMSRPVIIDLRNIYNPDEIVKGGFVYSGIGRPLSLLAY